MSDVASCAGCLRLLLDELEPLVCEVEGLVCRACHAGCVSAVCAHVNDPDKE